jgi:hypothetical protein
VERAQSDELVSLGIESYLLRYQRHDVRGIEDAVAVVGSGGCVQGRKRSGAKGGQGRSRRDDGELSRNMRSGDVQR